MSGPDTLNSPLCNVCDLSPQTIGQMRSIFEESFSNCIDFERDLSKKNWAILLRDEHGQLSGFSTLSKSNETFADGQQWTVFFSGDTVVRPSCRNRFDLPQIWAHQVYAMVANEPLPCYWFFICSGFRTYRFLPTFYREFFPRYDQATPTEVQYCLDTLGRRRFGKLYQNGIVQLSTPCSEPPPSNRRLDAHSQFFLQRNPGWIHGHELACLTRLHPDNHTPAGRRMVKQP